MEVINVLAGMVIGTITMTWYLGRIPIDRMIRWYDFFIGMACGIPPLVAWMFISSFIW